MALAVGSSSDQVRVSSGLDTLAGLWLSLSAFLLPLAQGPAWDLVLAGLVVAVLGAARSLGRYAPSWPSWLNAGLGLWTLLSPWVLGRAEVAGRDHVWNAVITGTVILALALWAALATGVRGPGAPAAHR